MKKDKIAWYIITSILSLALVILGVLHLIAYTEKNPEMIAGLKHVQFSFGAMPLLAVLKVLGGLALLFVPNDHIKVASYAGVIFYGLGIMALHLSAGDGISGSAAGIFFIVLASLSYFFYLRTRQVASQV